MQKKIVLFLTVSIAAILFAEAVNFLQLQLKIDDCLDGGGAWNYKQERCER